MLNIFPTNSGEEATFLENPTLSKEKAYVQPRQVFDAQEFSRFTQGIMKKCCLVGA